MKEHKIVVKKMCKNVKKSLRKCVESAKKSLGKCDKVHKSRLTFVKNDVIL